MDVQPPISHHFIEGAFTHFVGGPRSIEFDSVACGYHERFIEACVSHFLCRMGRRFLDGKFLPQLERSSPMTQTKHEERLYHYPAPTAYRPTTEKAITKPDTVRIAARFPCQPALNGPVRRPRRSPMKWRRGHTAAEAQRLTPHRLCCPQQKCDRIKRKPQRTRRWPRVSRVSKQASVPVETSFFSLQSIEDDQIEKGYGGGEGEDRQSEDR